MRPLRTGVGCVPVEVVGVFVLNLCELQMFVSREEKKKKDLVQILIRIHKEFVELHNVLRTR